MTSGQVLLALGWVLASLGLALWMVALAIAYARHRGMFDQPGRRRSHIAPTPRGGGIGLVAACLLTVPGALLSLPDPAGRALVAGLAAASALVALVGWLDDHRPLGVLPRIGVQLSATALFGAVLVAASHAFWWLPLLVLAGTWSINLHNFMDGIDGLLAQQAIFVAAGLGLLAASAMQPALAVGALAVAAAALGFCRYNWSPARIFMGDVGSGTLGFLLFAFTAMLWWRRPSLLWPALVLSSSFVADASLTLLSRFLRGRRWYSPHREHLYQWLVRRGYPHGKCAALYLAWNLLIALPTAIVARYNPGLAFLVCVAVYTAAVATWIVTKRRCLRRDLHEAPHVST